jgi:membrane protease YdiL (CAAX protease family)
MPDDGGWGRDDADDDAWGRDRDDGDGWGDDPDSTDDRDGDAWTGGDEWDDPPGVGADPDPEPAPADRDTGRAIRRVGSPPREGALWAIGAAVGLSVATIVATIAVILPVALLIGAGGIALSPVVSTLLSLALIQYVAFGAVIVGYLHYRGTTVREYVAARVPSLREFGAAIGGWVFAFVLVIALSVVIQSLGLSAAENQSAQQGMENPEIFLVLIPASFLVIGPMEELLFRGTVQGRLRESLSPAPAIVASAILFAAVHAPLALSGTLAQRLTTVGVLFFPSLVFGALYEYTENLTVPALVHALYDATIFGILYLGAVYGPEEASSGGEAVLTLLGL